MKSLLLTGFFVLFLSCCNANLRQKKVTRKRFNCPTPSEWPFDAKCAQKREECRSGFFSTDSCRERLACRFRSFTLGAGWDTGIKGICRRNPKNLGLCKDICSESPPKTKCYFHRFMESANGYGIDILSSDRFYSSCKCYKKCFYKTTKTVRTGMNVQLDLSIRQTKNVFESFSPHATFAPKTCSCRDQIVYQTLELHFKVAYLLTNTKTNWLMVY